MPAVPWQSHKRCYWPTLRGNTLSIHGSPRLACKHISPRRSTHIAGNNQIIETKQHFYHNDDADISTMPSQMNRHQIMSILNTGKHISTEMGYQCFDVCLWCCWWLRDLKGHKKFSFKILWHIVMAVNGRVWPEILRVCTVQRVSGCPVSMFRISITGDRE